ncbi:MAG: deoxycytidylate deaminase [Bacteroidota bacterium]
MERPSKEEYYLRLAEAVSARSTCLRRRFGAVIVKDDQIISTGYAGAPRGTPNCLELGVCPREKAGIPAGQRYELCRSVHAEANAIIHAARRDMLGGTLYLACVNARSGELVPGTRPCKMCTRLIINAGLKEVFVREEPNRFSHYLVADWVRQDTGLADPESGY